MFIENNTAMGATQFRQERQNAGLPVATNAQTTRALRLIATNPTLREHFSPMGIELMALKLPLTRSERIANRRSIEKGGLGITLSPHVVRTNKRSEFEADHASSEAFVDANPNLTEREAAEAVAIAFGFQGDINVVVKRVERFSRSNKEGRVCGHMRNNLLMLSAMAQVINLVREREEKEQTDGQNG